MRTMTMRTTLVLAATAFFLTATPTPALADPFDIGQGPLAAIKNAAQDVLDAPSDNCGLSKNELAAVMLSIPMWEILGGATTKAPSPMVLSRYDSYASRSANLPLYSFSTWQAPYLRAHWNPGVGLFQLDTWDLTQDLSQGQRVKLSGAAGTRVANWLRQAKCDGVLWSRVSSNWFACASNHCQNAFNSIYVSSNDTLNLDVRTGMDEWDGGLREYQCRWNAGAAFNCTFYKAAYAEGYIIDSDPDGNGQYSPTPLANPFYSFSGEKKWMIWLQAATGWDVEIEKKVGLSVDAREVDNWSTGSDLQVWVCGDTQPPCVWSTQGHP